MNQAPTSRPGRRERNAREKHSRIFTAAAALFDERGFDGATTQEIAERADVGAGTLFRYAATKGELFLMVFNEQLRQAIDEGARCAEAETDVTRAVLALVVPVLTRAHDTEQSAVYQRELLFGSPGERYRSEGIALVDRLEALVAARLVAAVEDGTADDERARAAARAARSVFAVLNLLLVQPLTGAHPGADTAEELAGQVTQIVRGFLAAPGGSAPTRLP
jgi:AcrR family transcriptional regulator